MAKRMPARFTAMKYYLYLLLVWGFFRFLFKFPELIEELWFKPIFWLVPLLFIWVNERPRINFFKGPVPKSLIWGLGVGLAYWSILFLAQGVRSGFTIAIDLPDIAWLDFAGISLVTAIIEEITFSGYFLTRLSKLTKNPWLPLVWTSLLFALLHVPIGLFLYQYNLYQLSFFLSLVLVIQLGNTYVMKRSGNILGPIISHWFWGLGATLFL